MKLSILKLMLFPVALMFSACGLTTSEISVAEDGTCVISGKGYASEQNNIFPILYAEAKSYCNERGMILQPVTCEGDFKPLNSIKVKFTFRCLLVNIPEQR